MTQLTCSEYLELLNNPAAPLPDTVEGLAGRISRGKAGQQHQSLSGFDGRRLAWVFGPDWLHSLLIDRRPWADVIVSIGKDREWLARRLEEGQQFSLIVFPLEDCVLATWDGVFGLLKDHYPEVATKVMRWAAKLREETAQQILGDRYDSYYKVKSDVKSELHMSLDRYLSAPDDVVHARAFLWHSLGLNELFRGNGYSPEGVPEYLVANTDVRNDFAVVPLDVKLD